MERLRKQFILFFITWTCLFNAISYGAVPQTLEPDKLSCEYRNNPLGIDDPSPMLSWTLASTARNQYQTAYEIIVSDNRDEIIHLKGNIWETGKVSSDQNIHIPYEGAPLKSFTRYYWRVRVYDRHSQASSWSEPEWFETAMLDSSDWKAEWIGSGRQPLKKDEDYYKVDPMPLFRKAFDIKKKVISARLYISGLGYYEAHINGSKVGDHVLDPGWTNYSKQVLYSVYDVSSSLHPGANAIGVILGNGWYNPLPLRMWGSRNLRDALTTGPPCLKAQLRICFADGTVQTLVTDTTWMMMPGPVLRNSVYLGEYYDARQEQPGWDLPRQSPGAFEGWRNAVQVQGPAGRLTAQSQPPVKIMGVIHPVRVTEPKAGVYVFDMGQNFSGVARIHVRGPKRTRVVLRYGEDLYSDGQINVMTSVAGQIKSGNGGPGAPQVAWQQDTYILKGVGQEVWSPRFTFHGFRYVEVTGWPGRPSLDDIEGLRMSADVEQAGTFTSSNTMFNQLYKNIKWTFRNNMFSVQSDCPAREKFGYGGDLFCTCDAFIYDFNMAGFYKKTLQDEVNDQRPLGGFTETAPYVGIADSGPGDKSGPLGFQISFAYLMKQLYDFYGDKRLIAKYFDAFKKQVEFLKNNAENYLSDADLGDHESLEKPSKEFTASLFYYQHAKLIAEFAALLGKSADAEKYAALADKIRGAVIQRFYVKHTGKFDTGTQSAQAFGLWYGLAAEGEKEKSLNLLLDDIGKHDGHLTTGIFGTKMLLDVLRREERNDVAYRMVDKRTFPGWGYMIDHGATTLWETWAYSDNVFSQDHPMFGSVNEWFYRSLLGINAGAPGFKRIIIKPQPGGDLTFVKGSYLSVMGPIRSEWRREGRRFSLHVEIPANTTAEVWLPAGDSSNISEGGKPIKEIQGIRWQGMKNGYAVFDVGSGDYHFESDYRK